MCNTGFLHNSTITIGTKSLAIKGISSHFSPSDPRNPQKKYMINKNLRAK